MDTRLESDASNSEELFGRPTTKTKIFVSSHMGQRNVLRAEREAAADAIESTGFARAWYWERDAHAGPYCSERLCARTAATSDGLVLILARKLTRVTLMEYKAAYDAGAPCFIFIKHGGRHDPEVNAFIAQERRSGAVTVPFGSLDELRTRIVNALHTHVVGAARRRALEVRLYRARGEPPPRADVMESRTNGERPRYEAIQLQIENEEGFKSAGEVIAEARDAAAAGHMVVAFEALNELAMVAQEAGFPEAAIEIVAELRAIVPGPTIGEEQHAWLLNTEGLARTGVGEHERAVHLFERMRTAGERLGDDFITSTALQNLGILAVFNREPSKAIEHYKRSVDLKRKVGDYYGLTQVLLNLAVPLLDAGDGEDAERMLHDLERPIRYIRDPSLLASLHVNLGQIAAKRGQFEIAQRRFRSALRIVRRSALNPQRELIALQNLGSLEVDQDQPARALRWYRKTLVLAKQLDTPRELELAHRSLGIALHALGRHEEAAAEFEQAAAAANECDDRFLWAENTANVGALHLLVDDFEAGVTTLNQALDVFRIIGDAQWQARVLENLAAAKQQTGDSAGALALLDVAAGLLTETPDEYADLLRRGAELALDTGQTVRAIDYLEREIEAARGQTPRQRAWRAATAGAMLSQNGAPAEAVAFFDRAVRIYERLGEHELLYLSVNDRAIAKSEQKLYQEARRDLTRCLRLARRRDDRAMEQQALLNLGEMDRREGRIRDSLRRLEKALDFARVLGDADAEAFTLGNLGLTLIYAERWDEARDAFERALTLARSLGEREHEATAIAGLADIAMHQGRKAKAARLYRRAAALRGVHDRRHLAEHLAGLVEALSALGRERELERELQRLVDLAQASGDEEVAVDGLARAAWWRLERGEREEAAYFHATAIAIAAVSSLPSEERRTDEVFVKALADALIQPSADLIRAGETLQRTEADALYALVVDEVNKQSSELGEIVRELLEDAVKAFRDETEVSSANGSSYEGD
jgi:tetratricopeptide (TPR) repeat protein